MKTFGGCVLLLLAIVGCLVAPSVLALLHEDEVGKREWYVAGVGRVEQAAFLTTPQVKNVYVATREGVVAALSTLEKGAIRWRHHIAAPQEPSKGIVCLAVTPSSVAAVAANGVGHVFNPSSGSLLTTFSIELPSDSAAVKGCAFVGTSRLLRVAAVDNTSITITNVPTDDAEALSVGPLAALRTKVLESTVTSIAWASGASLLWIEKGSGIGIDAYDVDADVLATSDIRGIIQSSVDVSNDVLVKRTNEDGKDGGEKDVGSIFHVLELEKATRTIKASGASRGTSCKHCRASLSSIATQPSDEAGVAPAVGIVVAVRETASDNSFDLYVGGVKTTVTYLGTGAPQVLATRAVTNSKPPRTEVLLRPSNGHLLLVSVPLLGTEGASIVWERSEGISAPVFAKVVPLKGATTASDVFGFDVHALILSQHGTLYRVPVAKKGEEVIVLADLSVVVRRLLPTACICGATYKGFSVDDSGRATVAVVLQGQTIWAQVDAVTGAIESTKQSPNDVAGAVTYVSGTLSIGSDLTVTTATNANTRSTEYFFSLNASHGSIQGLSLAPGATKATKTWSVQLGSPVVAHNSPSDNPLIVSTVQNLRIFPNTSATKDKYNEVRRKYPTHNVLAVATVNTELSKVSVTVLDVVTGSILATAHAPGASGPVKVLVVEHAVIFHFLNVERMRYAVGVLELFEHEDSIPLEATGASPAQVIASMFVAKKTFSSLSAKPPAVAFQILAFPGGALEAMSATTSYQGINRKQVIFALADGRVHAADLRQLLFGGQIHPQKPEETFQHVSLPSINAISHVHQILLPKVIATTPTELESSAHVLVAGVDLFYARVSLGKAFDMLNEDFNYELLIAVCGVMALLTWVARYFADRKALKQAWA